MSDAPITSYDAFLESTFGEELEAFLSHPPVDTFLRVNPLRTTPEALDAAMARYGVVLEPHPISPLVRRVVSHRPEVPPGVCLPHFLGHFRLQALASMVPPLLLDAQPGEKVLDLCAAPGSKTTQLAAQMELRGQLWVNELAGKRMNQLAAALDSAGALNTVLLQESGTRLPNLFEDTFDRVLADVPCTGLGIRDNLGQGRARFEEVGRPSNLPFIQYQLLVAALRLVKPGGRVVYSTCSLTVEENEAILHDALTRFDVRMVPPPDLPGLILRPGRTSHRGRDLHPDLRLACRITPWENRTEGFFAATLERLGELPERHERRAVHDPRRRTLPHDAPEIEPTLTSLSTVYGIPREAFTAYRYARHARDKVYFTSAEVEDAWCASQRIGAGLASRRGAVWRPSPTTVQTFAPLICRNLVTLDDGQLRELIATDRCPLSAAQRAELTTIYPAAAHPTVGPFASLELEPDGRARWKVPRRYELE